MEIKSILMAHQTENNKNFLLFLVKNCICAKKARQKRKKKSLPLSLTPIDRHISIYTKLVVYCSTSRNRKKTIWFLLNCCC